MTFADGRGYTAVNVINNRDKITVVAAGHHRGEVTFVLPRSVHNVEVEHFDGRETAKLVLPNGKYFVSSASVADVGAAQEIVEGWNAQK